MEYRAVTLYLFVFLFDESLELPPAPPAPSLVPLANLKLACLFGLERLLLPAVPVDGSSMAEDEGRPVAMFRPWAARVLLDVAAMFAAVLDCLIVADSWSRRARKCAQINAERAPGYAARYLVAEIDAIVLLDAVSCLFRALQLPLCALRASGSRVLFRFDGRTQQCKAVPLCVVDVSSVSLKSPVSVVAQLELSDRKAVPSVETTAGSVLILN